MEELNNQRLSAGWPLLLPSEHNYGYPRFNVFLESQRYQEFRARAQHLSGAGSAPQRSFVANAHSENTDIEMESEDTSGLVIEKRTGRAESDVTIEEGPKSKGEQHYSRLIHHLT